MVMIKAEVVKQPIREQLHFLRSQQNLGFYLKMAEGRTPRSHFTRVTKIDKDLRKAVLKLMLAVRNVRKDDVTITYPQNKEEDLVVTIDEEVFYSERLPDMVVAEQCKIRGLKEKNGKTELKLHLVKETHGSWKNKWCMEKQS